MDQAQAPPQPPDQQVPHVPPVNGQNHQNQVPDANNAVVDALGCLMVHLNNQGALNNIKTFDGNVKEFKDWIKAVEKYGQLNNANENRLKFIAYQTSSGPVSTFINRYCIDHQDCTWQNFKQELHSKFGDIVDASHALRMLRKLKQKPGETIQTFVENILDLANDAFPNVDLNQVPYSNQLIDIFTDGLISNTLARLVIRNSPENLDAAVTLVINENNMLKRLKSYHRQDEPMEIDSVENKCFLCHKVGHLAFQCRFQKGSQKHFQGKCFNCGKIGHKAKFCRQGNFRIQKPKLNANQNNHKKRYNQDSHPRSSFRPKLTDGQHSSKHLN